MTVELNPDIKNNLFVSSVLSSALEFTDETYGEDNKKTLLNRVKKLSQAERKDLLGELNEISSRINPLLPLPPETPPLQEKGLSTFILTDDGKKAGGHCFIVSFFLGLMNLTGSRISSASIMQKLSDTRNLLDARGYHHENIDIETGLNAQISLLENKLQEQNPAEKINPLIDELNEIRETFSKASKGDWAQAGTFISFNFALSNFKDQVAAQISSAKNLVKKATKGIKEILQVRKTNNLQALSVTLLKEVFPILELAISKDDLHPFRTNLDNLAQGELVPKEMENFGYWEKHIIIPYIELVLKVIQKKLLKTISEFEFEKSKTQSELEIIRGRLTKYQQNAQNAIKRRELAAANLVREQVEKEFKNYTTICVVIGSATELLQTKAQGLKSVKEIINLAYEDFAGSPDAELKATNNFERHLRLLKDFSVDFETNKQGLANALDKLELLNGNAEAPEGLYNRLKRFKSNPVFYSSPSDKDKIQFLTDYFAYWKFIFEKSKLNKDEELKGVTEAQTRIEEELAPHKAARKKVKKIKENPKPQPKLIENAQPPKPAEKKVEQNEERPKLQLKPIETKTPTVDVVTTTVRSDDLLPALNIPQTGNAYLITIATQLQNNRSNTSDLGWYQQVTPSANLPKGLVEQVYGNFYWIMKDAGNLCGELNNDGHAKDSKWGEKVFSTGSVNGVGPSVPRPTLNDYRVQAMVEALEGKTR